MNESAGDSRVRIQDLTANPGPLGLLGFGMTTVLLNLSNAGLYPLGSSILAMGIFYGGIAQVIAGIMEWKKGNTFGTTAFISFGFFWISLVGLLVLPKLGLAEATSKIAMASYLFIWGLFAAVMFIGTLKHSRALQFVFGSVTLLFILLALGDATGNAVFTTIAGYEGVICGLSAMYTGLGEVMNDAYKEKIVKLG